MKVMILCGGQGTRIRDVAENIPKPLVDVGGRPILWHIMKLYAHFGFKEFVLLLGYKGSAIKDFFLSYEAHVNDCTLHLGRPGKLELHGEHPESDWSITLTDTGLSAMTGARIARAARYLGADDDFMVTYGDGVGDVDLSSLLAFHRKHGKLATLTGVRPPGRFGELEVEGTRVREFAEKPQAREGLINGGFFVFKRAFVDRYLKEAQDSLVLEREPLQRAARDGELMVHSHQGFWQPMDTYREWTILNDLWNQGRAPWKVWKS
jgi:glucose-1-phosphate cytidylyltransferase